MRKWLARLSFSLIILALVLAWEGRRVARTGGGATPYYAGAVVLVALGLAGIRERHRQ
jgi:hypothetical protein